MQAKEASLGTIEIRSTPNKVETRVEDRSHNNNFKHSSPEDDAETHAAPMPNQRRGGQNGVRMLFGKHNRQECLRETEAVDQETCCDVIRCLSCVRTAQQLTSLLNGPATH